MVSLRAIGHWFEDRTGLAGQLGPLMKHPVPPEATWLYVFGSATLTAFLVQIVTGVALAALYVPGTNEAYESLRFIDDGAPVGHLLRGMHFFGASAMVGLAVLHMIRVFLTGAFKFPREMSWLSGSFLLLFTLGMGFTGQLLRFDQNAIWTVVVGAEQAGRTPFIGTWMGRLLLGGPTLGSDTLSRFFTLHVFVLPGLLVALLGLHLYLVLHNGVSEPPRAGRPVDRATYRGWYHRMLQERGVPFWPDAIWRDAVFGALVVGVIILLAWLVGAPELSRPADPTIVQAEPRPDWYFLFYFALLALMPHGLESYVIILAPLVMGAILLLVPLLAPLGERAVRRRPWAVGAVVAGVTIWASLTVSGVHADWSPHFDAKPLPASVVASTNSTVQQGAQLFHDRACIYCHRISGYGGRRGPDLSHIGALLTKDQLVIRILNGGYNMPAYGAILAPGELDAIIGFLESRR